MVMKKGAIKIRGECYKQKESQRKIYKQQKDELSFMIETEDITTKNSINSVKD